MSELAFAPEWCDDVTADPFSASCVPGCRWLVRVAETGLDRNGRTLRPSALDDLVAKLPGTPVRAYWDPAAQRLTHPPEPHAVDEALAVEITVGFAERAWPRDSAVFGVVHLWHSVTRLHRALLRAERAGRLIAEARTSLVYFARHDPQQRNIEHAVTHVVALDIVSNPAIRDAGFIRHLAADELRSRADVPALQEA
jgi:hypothetical protein